MVLAAFHASYDTIAKQQLGDGGNFENVNPSKELRALIDVFYPPAPADKTLAKIAAMFFGGSLAGMLGVPLGLPLAAATVGAYFGPTIVSTLGISNIPSMIDVLQNAIDRFFADGNPSTTKSITVQMASGGTTKISERQIFDKMDQAAMRKVVDEATTLLTRKLTINDKAKFALGIALYNVPARKRTAFKRSILVAQLGFPQSVAEWVDRDPPTYAERAKQALDRADWIAKRLRESKDFAYSKGIR